MREQKWAIVGFALLAYGVAYAAVWFTRADCQGLNAVACGAAAAMKAGGDLVQFAWVWDNPEIATGLMTVAAALTVFATLNQQRKWAVADAEASRRDQSLFAIINVRHAFQRVFNCLYAIGGANPLTWQEFRVELTKAMENLRVVMSANAAFLGSNIATHSEIIMSDIDDILRAAPAGVGDSREIQLASGMTVLMGRYLDAPDLLIGKDGRPVGGPIPVPDDFEDRLDSFNLNSRSLTRHLGVPIGNFFILDK